MGGLAEHKLPKATPKRHNPLRCADRLDIARRTAARADSVRVSRRILGEAADDQCARGMRHHPVA
jgi:hypothetical protein